MSDERQGVLAHIDGKIATYKARSIDTTTPAEHRAEFAISMQTLSVLRGEIHAGLHEGLAATEAAADDAYVPSAHLCHFKAVSSGGYACIICGEQPR